MKNIVQLVQNLLKPYIDRKDRATQANIAPVETDATSASKAYSVGAQLILSDVLYDVTAPIAQNDALTVGTNIAAADDLETQIASVNSAKEDKPTILTQTLAAGSITLTFTNAAIGNNSRIRYLSDPFVVGLIENAVQSGTTITLTCKEQASNVSVKLEVYN